MESSTSIVTTLGGGSGIDMAALVQNLATAQFQMRPARLTTRAETLDRQISAASSLKSQILQLASALGERVRTGDLSPPDFMGSMPRWIGSRAVLPPPETRDRWPDRSRATPPSKAKLPRTNRNWLRRRKSSARS